MLKDQKQNATLLGNQNKPPNLKQNKCNVKGPKTNKKWKKREKKLRDQKKKRKHCETLL